MSYINRLVYKKHVSYLVIIDCFYLYSIIASLIQLTGELAGAFTTMPCLLATLKQVMGPEGQVLCTQYKHKYFLHLALT